MSAPRAAGLVEAARAAAWTGGIVMILLAIAMPFAHRYLYVAPFRDDLKAAADRMVERQRDELVRRERFATDVAQEVVKADARIAAEARLLADGRLLVRTMTAADAVRGDWLPAMIFERIVDHEGEATEGVWRVKG